jgi:hypothetical protein
MFREGGVALGTTTNLNYSGMEVVTTANGWTAVRARTQHASFTSWAQSYWVDRAASTDFYQARWIANFASSADYQFSLRGDGNGYCDGSWSGGGGGLAEYFESDDGPLEVGKCVVMDGDKVRLYANSDDAEDIIGVVRPSGTDAMTATVIGNAAFHGWHSKYLRDDFGRYLREDREVVEWDNPEATEEDDNRTICYYADAIPDDVTVPDDAVRSVQSVRKLNPDFDGEREYVPREDRDEWALIELLGQVPVKAGEIVPSRWIKMKAISDAADLYLVR